MRSRYGFVLLGDWIMRLREIMDELRGRLSVSALSAHIRSQSGKTRTYMSNRDKIAHIWEVPSADVLACSSQLLANKMKLRRGLTRNRGHI